MTKLRTSEPIFVNLRKPQKINNEHAMKEGRSTYKENILLLSIGNAIRPHSANSDGHQRDRQVDGCDIILIILRFETVRYHSFNNSMDDDVPPRIIRAAPHVALFRRDKRHKLKKRRKNQDKTTKQDLILEDYFCAKHVDAS